MSVCVCERKKSRERSQYMEMHAKVLLVEDKKECGDWFNLHCLMMKLLRLQWKHTQTVTHTHIVTCTRGPNVRHPIGRTIIVLVAVVSPMCNFLST